MSPRLRGFTLVETIFATLFIGLTVLAIVNLFPGAYLSIRRSETAIQADLVAKSVIDELRLVPFDELQDGVVQLTGAPFDPWTIEGITYTVAEVRIYDVPDTEPQFLKGVKVTISYRIGHNLKTTVHETYLHKLIR